MCYFVVCLTRTRFGHANSNTITCLIHDSIPASVDLPDPIPAPLKPHIKLGKDIKFQITKVDFSKCLLLGDVSEQCIGLMNVKKEHIS